MILMVGILADPVICYFMDYCMDSKVDFAFVDVNLLGKEIFFDQTHWFIPNSPPLAHKSITGVFNRVLFSWANYHELQKDLLIRLFNWMDTIYPNVLNRPKSTYSNLSKPLQLQWASAFLFGKYQTVGSLVLIKLELRIRVFVSPLAHQGQL